MAERVLRHIDIPLPYGNSILNARLAALNPIRVIHGKQVPGLKDEIEAIRQALNHPIGSAVLRERVGKNDKVLVITTDNTRPCPDDRILPVLLDEIEQVVPTRNITIVVALGLHASLDKEQLTQKLGERIVENYRVINHDPDQTVHLGATSRGTPVEVSNEVVEADLRISTGFVEPHFFAGFSGGRKSIAPGLSSANAIRQNHNYAMVEHSNARAGVLKGNPIHEDMVEQARMAGLDFIVNVLLNKERQITHVFAGDPFLAHEAACEVEKGIVQTELDHTVDITVVTNSGAPLDLDFYQTCKGIDTAAQITRPGGAIIAVSSCYTGVGPREFENLQCRCRSPREILQTIAQENSIGVGWQNQILARAQLEHDVFLLSNLDDSVVRLMMVTPIHSVQEGLDMACAKLGKKSEIAVIPEGPLALPVVRGNA
jgi:nickel-dependent lactate racemase